VVETEVAAMRLQQRTTVIVVVVFAVLAVLVYLVEVRGGQGTPADEEGVVPVLSFELDEAILLKVTDLTTGESVTVTKSPEGAWYMTEPFESEGDDTRVEGVLGRLSALSSTRVIEGEDVNLEAFGLAEPTLRVELGLEDGESQVLLVGDENPVGYSRYAQREGEERVYLVGSSTIGDLEQLIADPPEKPTPTPTETPLPAVITDTRATPLSDTPTISPTVPVED
jgi:hypothetical protein